MTRRAGQGRDYRLRVGAYRVMYRLGEDLITVGQVSRIAT